MQNQLKFVKKNYYLLFSSNVNVLVVKYCKNYSIFKIFIPFLKKKDEKFDKLLTSFKCEKIECNGLLDLDNFGNIECLYCSTKYNRPQLEQKFSLSKQLYEEGLKKINNENLKEGILVLQQSEKIAQPILSPFHFHLLHIVSKLTKVSIDAQEWKLAIEYCRKSLLIYERVYPPSWPLLGLQVFLIKNKTIFEFFFLLF